MNVKEEPTLRLVPSNWFYNLSVYGFLKVLNNECGIDLEEKHIFKDDGSVEINLQKYNLLEETEEIAPEVRSFKLWDCLLQHYKGYYLKKDKEKFKNLEQLNSLKELYENLRGKIFYELRNLFNPNPKGEDFRQKIDLKFFKLLKDFLKFSNKRNHSIKCQYCGNYPVLDEFLKEYKAGKYYGCLNESDKNIKKTTDIEFQAFCKAFKRLRYLNLAHIPYLAPSLNEYPNSFWNFNYSIPLCLICNFLFLFYPLGLINIGGRKIFINAPSFELIWKLNNHIEKLHSKDVYKDIKTLFGLGFIELALDLNVKLGIWQKLSTEIILFQGQSVDFYEIPSQILELLEDKRISSLMMELNNLKILEVFMNGNFKIFEILIYRLLRSKEYKGNKEDSLLEEFHLPYGPNYNPKIVKILSKLYTLIVSKLKKPAEVEL